MPNFKRRKLLLTGAAFTAAPLIAGRARAADTDVVVIGAGAAGISVARDLSQKGLSVMVIEAANRIGGRVHTDHDIFGVPFDIGAHWLHNAAANPFKKYGQRNGFSIYRAPSDEVLRVGDRNATTAEQSTFDKGIKSAYRAIAAAALWQQDITPAEVVPDFGDWSATVHLAVGPYEMAKDYGHFSCKDWYSAEGGTDYYCREGFGTLFAHHSRNVPVTLNTAARRIKWGGTGVEVHTNRGTITAQAVVVTVSTGVLAAGGLTFDPPLPSKTEAAYHQITMGHYNHVALRFNKNFFGVGEDGYFFYKVDGESNGSPKGFAALIDASGTGISYCDLGGAFARDMAKAGDAATLDFVKGELRRMFGKQVDKALVKAHVSEWTTNPLTLGSYASAEPGGVAGRKQLCKPVGNRIWFAGEACSEDEWATVAGAHNSGKKAARSLARKIKA